MGVNAKIRAFILGLGKIVPATGPRILPTGTEDFAAHMANEGAGGHHGYDSLEDMATANPVLLHVPMTAIVQEHMRPSGAKHEVTIYYLFARPEIRISEMAGELEANIALYWKAYTTTAPVVDGPSITIKQTNTLPAGQLATVENIGDSKNQQWVIGIPGGPDGKNGVFSADDYWQTPTLRFSGRDTGEVEWDLRFRKAKNGLVYYQMRTYKFEGNESWRSFNLPQDFIPAGFGWGSNRLAGTTITDRMALLPGNYHHHNGLRTAYPANVTRKTDATYILDVPFMGNWVWMANGVYATDTVFNV